jgi:hypothetical protein
MSGILNLTTIGWILYLSGNDDDFLNDPGSLVVQELGNDVAPNDTGPYDGEVCVSGHGVLSTCARFLDLLVWCFALSLFILFLSPSVCLGGAA